MDAKTKWLGGVAFLLVMAAGCLEREEKITVKSDGSVEIRVRVKGEPADVHNGDALPTAEAGWKVKEEVEEPDSEQQKVVLTAELDVARGRPLPGSFVRPGDAAEATALRFPTDLTIEPRRDGTYYHFRRVYEGRQLAEFDLYQKRFEKYIESLKLGNDNPIESLTFEQRRDTIAAMLNSVAMQQGSLVMAAAAESNPDWPPDYALRLRQRTMEHFGKADVAEVAELLAQPASEERDSTVSSLADEIVASNRDVLFEELRALRVSRKAIDEFFAAFEEEEQRREITKDLRDETWKIRLRLPGELIAHNGDSVEDKAIVWQFEADALMDRDQMLMATSRVRGGEAPERNGN